MNDKLKIKLSIADRVYPLTIAPKQEEGLRKAAKKIEETIKQFEKSYAVRDKQDVLAMCALQFAAKTEQQNINKSDQVLLAEEKLNSLDQLLQEHLFK
ncbi:cell division protein ZapA [Mesonia maritima]|uniref:Cell division protein ZapA n=1 Tax=Mesonia maritima TaxID=1793873 RepID=A0ABU1K9D7_9FLAO|nr:cell division protein ZapA [Mesonia maritima]MDR6302208.1 cell division protein ZapA [Mesonia maritima]